VSDFTVLAGFFLFVMAGVVLAGYAFWDRKPPVKDNEEQGSAASVLDEPPLPGTQAFLAKAFRKVGETVPGASAASNPIRRLLMSAGYRYPSALPIFYGIKCALGLFFAAMFGVFGASNGAEISSALIATVCGGGFGYLLPDFLLKPMIRARGRRIRRALPAALDLLILSVEAGQSLNQALVDTGLELREAHPELAAELAQAHLELRAGKRRAEALQELGGRNGDPELKKLCSLLIDSDRFGTSLAPALRTHVKYLRTRMRQQAQESARKVSVKLIFPVFFLIFPSVLLVTLGPAVLHMMKEFAETIGK
jgi:tight adherence protein C